MLDDVELEGAPDLREPPATTQPSLEQEPVPWRQELSERVQTFRQRRRLRNEPLPEENLDLEFEWRENQRAYGAGEEKVSNSRRTLIALTLNLPPLFQR